MIGPLHRSRRRERTVLVVLRCTCGYAERWPLPFTAEVGRCTCRICGGQLHEDAAGVAAETAWGQTG